MQNQATSGPKLVLETPKPRRSILKWLTILGGTASVCAATWAWQNGLRPSMDYFAKPIQFRLVEVDRGDIVQVVLENGSLESASDSTVKCRVEALIGMVGGTTGNGTGNSTGGSGGRSGSGGGGTSGRTGGSQGGQAAATTTTTTATTKSNSARTGSGASKVKTSGSSSKSGSSTGSSSGASGGGTSSSTATASTASSTGTATMSTKPVIRSFSYMVTPHIPLKGAAVTKNTTEATKSASMGNGGGRGGRGGGNMMEEKPGSTRILTIIPEGTRVKKGQVVCELDSSTFRDELKAQKIRHLQASAWVDQAASILEVSKIALREYRDGIFPQDVQLIRQYIQTCQIEKDMAVRNANWSNDMLKKGLRARSQVIADELAVQQTSIALDEARGMLLRLEKFTGPKILKSLEAKVAAVLTDKLAQDASLSLETERLRRLEKNIANCTLRAPDDGVVVYVNQTNGWGRVEQPIEQGVTVRQDQPIFQLPDPRRLRVKVRINETKVAMVKSGQECQIVIDAFPERKLRGKVLDVTAIATPVNGPFSDVRVYFAYVAIEDGFDDLRPGLSAEVSFLSDQRRQVERVPLSAVRSVGDESFVAVPDRSKAARREAPYRWQKVELGLSGPDFVEVISGVHQGDRVIADALSLEAPASTVGAVSSSPIASLTP